MWCDVMWKMRKEYEGIWGEDDICPMYTFTHLRFYSQERSFLGLELAEVVVLVCSLCDCRCPSSKLLLARYRREASKGSHPLPATTTVDSPVCIKQTHKWECINTTSRVQRSEGAIAWQMVQRSTMESEPKMNSNISWGRFSRLVTLAGAMVLHIKSSVFFHFSLACFPCSFCFLSICLILASFILTFCSLCSFSFCSRSSLSLSFLSILLLSFSSLCFTKLSFLFCHRNRPSSLTEFRWILIQFAACGTLQVAPLSNFVSRKVFLSCLFVHCFTRFFRFFLFLRLLIGLCSCDRPFCGSSFFTLKNSSSAIIVARREQQHHHVITGPEANNTPTAAADIYIPPPHKNNTCLLWPSLFLLRKLFVAALVVGGFVYFKYCSNMLTVRTNEGN